MEAGRISVLSVGDEGAALTLVVAPQGYTPPGEDPWFDTEVVVDAEPFHGTVQTILTLSDLQEWATSLRALNDGLPGSAVLGGDRRLEMKLDVEAQDGDRVALEIELTPSGDDPYPLIRYLIFDVRLFWTEVADRIDLLGP